MGLDDDFPGNLAGIGAGRATCSVNTDALDALTYSKEAGKLEKPSIADAGYVCAGTPVAHAFAQRPSSFPGRNYRHLRPAARSL